MQHKVLILDFGSQYTQLIARKVRSLHIYCEIHPFNIRMEQIQSLAPQAIIFSGSPYSINDQDSLQPDEGIWQLRIPILGICYGMQLLVTHFGGTVLAATKREYGSAILNIINPGKLLSGLGNGEQVWM
ncbi:MAG TPA: gamma-glutamyl-gamma-aminobutyrate hydrolase family protein, partial [Candidatus Cloacimonas sp.]|nr:gamma-glutamyl-gamma-aminobutyrate hydrolase family protein [Candidatus Cloacimonas sp.]